VIFLNGKLLDPAEARIDPADRGFLLGDGLFETLRAYRGRPFRLAAHLARLRAGAEVLGIPVPMTDAAIADAVSAVLRANGLAESDASIRVTLTRGAGPRGLLPPPEPTPTLMITAAAYTAPEARPRRAAIASIRRNDRSPAARLKTLGYLDNVLALREAAARGFEEVILLNTKDRVASGSHGNLFLVIDGALRTPPPEEGLLPGITRALILDLARDLGVPARAIPIEAGDLARAEEAFLTNSLVEIAPLARIEDRTIGNGEPGPLTQKVRRRYREITASG